MNKIQLLQKVKEEIYSASVIPTENKDQITEQISMIVNRKNKRSCWFELRVILFQNRYSNMDKDKFLRWLETTHLRELADAIK